MTIKCKAVMLAKYFKWLIVSGIVTSVTLFLSLEIDLSYLYLLAVLFVFSGILISFYLNRNELEMIKIEETRINLIFLNKVFFKRKTCNFQKNELQQKQSEEVIDLYHNHQLIARIRKIALEKDDWKRMEKYFNEI